MLVALAVVAAARSAPMWLATSPQRAAWTYEAANGKTYPYLSGMDSYSWVRKARNYLTQGSPCDVETAEGCRDLLRHAPVGSAMPYTDSLHIRAIAWLHRLLAVFDAKRPIDGSAFWVQVVVGTLGVVPAWLIGRRLGGPWAGLLAALWIGLHPIFLERSLSADNDVWNVILPVCAAAAVLQALADARRRAGWVWAGVAAGFVALHAAIWRGWIFGFVILVVSIVASALWSAVRTWATGDRARLPSTAGPPLIVAAVFVACTGVLTAALPGHAPRVTTDVAASEPEARSPVFPDSLREPGELQVLTTDRIIERLGGPLVVLGAVLGVVVLLLPGARGRPRARADGSTSDAVAPGLLVAIWLAAALSMALDAQRWLLLAVAPVGLAYAGGAARIVSLVRQGARTPAAGWIALAALATPLGLGAYDGFLRAQTTLPKLNDAWWKSLRDIEAGAPPNAVVNTTWPYGYWIEYVARRGVTADGSSLLTHVPHWMGRALLATDMTQALGLLRMLDCGSDAWPEPEGRLGAYARLRAAGADAIAAYDLVLALARVDRAAADRLLEDRQFAAAAREEILAATHCSPPPAYLMISDVPSRQPATRRHGTWDPRRATLAYRLRALPEAEAISTAVGELALPESEARTLYRTARTLRTDAAVEQFIAPSPAYYTGWIRCRRDGGLLVCDANVRRREGLVLERFTFPVTAGPGERGTLQFREGGGVVQRSPDALVVADATDVRDLPPKPAANVDGWGVLLDVQGARAMFGPPYLIRSLLTRLAWLQRPPRGFEKTGDRAAAGERVTTWRIAWPPAVDQ